MARVFRVFKTFKDLFRMDTFRGGRKAALGADLRGSLPGKNRVICRMQPGDVSNVGVNKLYVFVTTWNITILSCLPRQA
jgi:hypothetical protein